jgi:ribulose-5-phosphate 4-epimerase/fuculose-1-phosphate aldolase
MASAIAAGGPPSLEASLTTVIREPDSDPNAERTYRKQRLAAAFRLLGRLGYDEGAAGHITARDPEQPEHLWVNPHGISFRLIRSSDLVRVNESGVVVEGSGRVNPAAFALHSRVHAARPDVVAACHSHSPHGKAWSVFRRPLEPLTQNACAFFEDHGVYAEYGGTVLDVEEGDRICAELGNAKALILSNHGLLTVGGSVEAATWWFISMERQCQVQLLASACALPQIVIDDEIARQTARTVGSEIAGRFSIRPMLDWIEHEEPDLNG